MKNFLKITTVVALAVVAAGCSKSPQDTCKEIILAEVASYGLIDSVQVAKTEVGKCDALVEMDDGEATMARSNVTLEYVLYDDNYKYSNLEVTRMGDGAELPMDAEGVVKRIHAMVKGGAMTEACQTRADALMAGEGSYLDLETDCNALSIAMGGVLKEHWANTPVALEDPKAFCALADVSRLVANQKVGGEISVGEGNYRFRGLYPKTVKVVSIAKSTPGKCVLDVEVKGYAGLTNGGYADGKPQAAVGTFTTTVTSQYTTLAGPVSRWVDGGTTVGTLVMRPNVELFNYNYEVNY